MPRDAGPPPPLIIRWSYVRVTASASWPETRQAGATLPTVGRTAMQRCRGKEIVLRQARGMRLVGALAVGGLVLAAAACGKPPAKSTTTSGASATGKPTHACMVTDTGGINDRSFNASAWAGMQAAKKQNSNI